MKAIVSRKNYNSLCIDFSEDQLDALPPLKLVWFKANNIGRIRDTRLSLILYLLTKHMLGNTLSLEGTAFPPFLASSIMQTFQGSELFLSPIKNTPELIAGRKDFRGFFCSLDSQEDDPSFISMNEGHLVCKRYELGYKIYTSGADSNEILDLRTNLDLWVAISDPNPRLTALVVIFLLVYDILGVSAFCCKTNNFEKLPLVEIERLLKEIGANVVFK